MGIPQSALGHAVPSGPASLRNLERCDTKKMLSFRSQVYNPRIRANSLVMQPISQSQAEIRKQIVGSSSPGSTTATNTAANPRRQATGSHRNHVPWFLPGKLFRLYSEEFASKDMRPLKPAEMQEANLTSMVLFVKRIDIAGLGHCDFINRPGSCVLECSRGAWRRRGGDVCPCLGPGLRAGGTQWHRQARRDLVVQALSPLEAHVL